MPPPVPGKKCSVAVTEEEVGERLDKILADRFPRQSRAYFQDLIDKRLVFLNGSWVKKGSKPRLGDQIIVYFTPTQEIRLIPEAIPLAIIYEDDDLLAVNKPAGMVVHPAPGSRSGTFVQALLHHCAWSPSDWADELRPGIVHRLDKDTSGVLLAAKHSQAQQKLSALFASRQVYKQYCAVCVGRPQDGEISAPIGRHPVRRKEMAVVASGRPAVSCCKVVGWDGNLSLVSMVIATGRTHQIRVHLKHAGTPILGDGLYGNSSANRRYNVDRQLLHAACIRFRHPVTGMPLELQAPPPPDMEIFIQKLSHADVCKIELLTS